MRVYLIDSSDYLSGHFNFQNGLHSIFRFNEMKVFRSGEWHDWLIDNKNSYCPRLNTYWCRNWLTINEGYTKICFFPFCKYIEDVQIVWCQLIWFTLLISALNDNWIFVEHYNVYFTWQIMVLFYNMKKMMCRMRHLCFILH